MRETRHHIYSLGFSWPPNAPKGQRHYEGPVPHQYQQFVKENRELDGQRGRRTSVAVGVFQSDTCSLVKMLSTQGGVGEKPLTGILHNEHPGDQEYTRRCDEGILPRGILPRGVTYIFEPFNRIPRGSQGAWWRAHARCQDLGKESLIDCVDGPDESGKLAAA